MAWTEQETLLLIDLWGKESVQVQIEGCARNKEVYAKLAARMQEEGYNRSGTQCREKIKKWMRHLLLLDALLVDTICISAFD